MSHMENATGPNAPKKPVGSISAFFLYLLIYAACDAVWAIIVAPLVPDSASELYATLFVNVYAGIAILLAFFTSREFRPKRIRTVWIIAAIAPLTMVAAFFICLLKK
jgi:drug/metabolite transporter (DMT)-like permease